MHNTVTDLVFLEPNKIDAIPFTTSKVIAEMTGIEHRKIKTAIRKHKEDIESFGRVAPYEAPLETKGGVQIETGYRLNEEQATFLMTLLKNTPVVVEFKKELVRQFYAMRKELRDRAVKRARRIPTRREMTDAIRDCVPESPHKDMYYRHYTDLAYRVAFGKSAAQIRKERNAPRKANASDYMTADEISTVTRIEKQIGVLVEMRLGYQQIKSMVLNPALQVVGADQPLDSARG